jgi:hypothetical protein
MKTNHSSTSVRFQTGLLITTAALGLIAMALVFPLRASGAMPAMPPSASASQSATAGQPPAQTMPMPAGGMMGGDMMKDMGAMMKHMSAMMDGMGGMMAAGKTDAMPMADMARMSTMMKNMGAMMGAMGGGADKAGSADGMGGMCPCCEKMMASMEMMGGAKAMAKPAPQPDDAKPATTTTPGDTAAPDATDHSAHHPAP